jgi:hypothetical protein
MNIILLKLRLKSYDLIICFDDYRIVIYKEYDDDCIIVYRSKVFKSLVR